MAKTYRRFGSGIDGVQTDAPSVLTTWTKRFAEMKESISIYSLARQSDANLNEEDLIVVELL